jgi:hypothetical protein
MILSVGIAVLVAFLFGYNNEIVRALIVALVSVAIQGILFLIFIVIRQRIYLKRHYAKIEIVEDKLPVINNCETEEKTCSICKLNFEPEQEIVLCPNCNNAYHLEHLKKWLKTNFYCPMCRYDFDLLFIDLEEYDIEAIKISEKR